MVDCFNYLGLTIHFNGKFTKTLKIIASQGETCMWHILSICNRLSLNMETLYEDMLQCQNGCNWLCQVKILLLSLGFGNVWYSQHVNNIEWVFLKCKHALDR